MTKKAFNVHAKKKQLQEKRQKKREKVEEYDWGSYVVTDSEGDKKQSEPEQTSTNNVTSMVTDQKSILRTFFAKEPRSVIDQRIMDSRLPLLRTSTEEEKSQYKDEKGDLIQQKLKDHIYTAVDMPVRPPWDYNMSKNDLEQQERDCFDKYLLKLKESNMELNYFELNLNVWRQLWRTLEISDLLLLVADVRHPLFHFPQSLYHYVTHKLDKPLILLLNKCDLVPDSFTKLWMEWFQVNYPKLHVVTFSSYADEQQDEANDDITAEKKRFKRKKKLVDQDLVYQIWKTCSQLHDKPEYWDQVMEKRQDVLLIQSGQVDPEEKRRQEKLKKRAERKQKKHQQQDPNDAPKQQVAKNEFVTVGLIGHPNTGKSCLLNGLVGRTVASASYTPGHTKHFQTYFVSKHVRLCDSPGLVFPAVDMPRALQVLCGLYPISQTREPYSAIRYLSERVPIELIYGLSDLPDGFDEWSPWALCEAYAIKKRYFTPKRARPDVYRAANEILRDVLYGRVLMCFTPPDSNNSQSLMASYTTSFDEESVKRMEMDNDDRARHKEVEESESDSDEVQEEEGVNKNVFSVLSDVM
ncbi:guanine nucleotide-binding protein-like GNL1 [Acrasis kona]|uniref:Guanine nucleotide-binding protein-like 1 n=1 Tax=Acrasis kona TaxID=1008807 RepID=A0AAW2Z9Z2_9EUKA